MPFFSKLLLQLLSTLCTLALNYSWLMNITLTPQPDYMFYYKVVNILHFLKSSIDVLHNFRVIVFSAAAAAKMRQLCPTLCDPIDGSLPGSSVPGILQTRTLEWVAMSFSNAWKWKVKMKLLSCVRLLATPWTVVYQAPPSMGFSRQEDWSGSPVPSSSFF